MSASRRRTRSNPRGVVVYPQVESVFARKADGQLYRHDFASRAPLMGQADGSLRIPGRPRKWARIDEDDWMVNPPRSRARGRKKTARRGRRRKLSRARGNPALAIYGAGNPGGTAASGGTTMSKRRNSKGRFVKGQGRARRRSSRRRHTIRAAAPARRRSHRRTARRRGYRRNPRILSGFTGLVPPMKTLLAGVGGATATRLITKQAERFLPAGIMGNAAGRAAVGAASAIAGGYLGGLMLGRKVGADMAAGGLIVMADELTRAYLLPAMGLSAYIDDGGISAFVDDGMSSYIDESTQVDALPEGDAFAEYMDDDLAGMETPSRLDPAGRL